MPAAWHLWLHGTAASPPTAKSVGDAAAHQMVANSHGSSAPYKRNVGGVTTSHTPNLSSYRPRGYGLGNGLTGALPCPPGVRAASQGTHKYRLAEHNDASQAAARSPAALLPAPPAGGSAPGEERFYTQPGNPLDARRNATTRPPRRQLPFSLMDTPETLRAKAAGRAGLTVAGYEQQQLAGTSTSASAGASAGAGADTLAAAARSALTASEAAFLAAGHDEDELLSTIQMYQRTVDDYANVPNKDAAAGVAKAKAVVADAAEKLATLRALNAKLRALAADFDARSVLKARAMA